MSDINFSQIRSYDGSQDNGFEELICQLAHLSPPENSDYFVRKEGAGGDAGVECYWKLKDGSEHAWQAKYFLAPLNAGQWEQISESVETALNKHPKLSVFYVCLPRDWTDSRKVRKGKVVKSAWDIWIEHTQKWTDLASSKGMNVEFRYWCKHELATMLTSSHENFSGRLLYWFSIPNLTFETLKQKALMSKEILGERYTPEHHIDLPIANTVYGLGMTSEWYETLLKKYQSFRKANSFISNVLSNTLPSDDIKFKITEIREAIIPLEKLIRVSIERNTFLDNKNDIFSNCKNLLEMTNIIQNETYLLHRNSSTDKLNALSRFVSNFIRELENLLDFLESTMVQAAETKAALIYGEAGIGKSHLLCDITLKRLTQSLPTLFILGNQYPGGNPLNFIAEQLDMRGHSFEEVLGVLDTLGETYSTRTLIIIDAINEGPNNYQWYDHIKSLIIEMKKYTNISLLISCRSTYLPFLIPEGTSTDILTKIHHLGFKGYEHRAASQYLEKQGISKPSAPIVSPEFSNPLFLKTCCIALKDNGYRSFPRGLDGISELFNFYLKSLSQIVNRKKRYMPGENIVSRVVSTFIGHLVDSNNFIGVAVSEARTLIDSLDPKPAYNDSLLEILLDEGLFSSDMLPAKESGDKPYEIIRFTYERFSDYFIADFLINKYIDEENITNIFNEEPSLSTLIKNKYRCAGILEALGVCIPEKFSIELVDILSTSSTNFWDNNYWYETLFFKSLTIRKPDSFSERTLELFNQAQKTGHYDERIDTLLVLSTEPNHPWNADFINKNLFKRSIADRDSFWSIHIAIADYEEDEEQPESVLRTLINWSLNAYLEDVEKERLRLIALTLMWMTSTSNRKVRDQATKSLSRILSYIPELIPDFVNKFTSINDPYVVERLYAAVYGALCNVDNKYLKLIAKTTYLDFFAANKPYPHLLMRDYARGIIELAAEKDLLDKEIDINICRPPYNSSWSIKQPTDSEINELGKEDYTSIKNSIMGFPGDFGNYTMQCVTEWSATPLSERKLKNANDFINEFSIEVPDSLRSRYEKYIDLFIKRKQIKSIQSNEWLKTFLQDIDEEFKDTEDDVIEGKFEDIDEELLDKELEELKEEILLGLSEQQKDYFNWLLGLDNRQATFNKKWAQKWVCKRAYELGWSKEYFSDFERHHASRGDRSTKRIERIGKKYQWIALYEFLALLSDNYHYNDRYSEPDNRSYIGPWQPWKRDLDPTMWLRSTNDNGWEEFKNNWWMPFTFPFVENELVTELEWLWNQDIVPPFKDLLVINNSWTILRGFSKWTKKPIDNEDIIPYQDAWFRVNTCIIKKSDFPKLQEHLKGKNLCDPSILAPSSSSHQAFLKEFPWHPSWGKIEKWQEPSSDSYERTFLNVPYIIPTTLYEWEKGDYDNSIVESISMYLPHPYLVKELLLQQKTGETNTWQSNGQVAFLDPSLNEIGPSYALIDSNKLRTWLESKEYQIVWLVGGEKQLFTKNASIFHGRQIYSGIYTENNCEIEGEMWFIEQHPNEN
ncbi:hypothetical protein ABGT22_23235 [Peribacillus frigoritolerans]|uniref:NACHT domain-containing protein n=1 Tax=Peribacillus frigoritolerans TaxID=450367 RepID=UPI00345DF10F